MQIDLKGLKVVPCLVMMVFALQTSINFNAIDMLMASYAMLAMTLIAALYSFFLIVRQHTITLTDLLSLIFMATIAVSSLFHDTDFVGWSYTCFSICLLRFFFNFYQHRLSPLIIGMALGFSIATMAQFYQLITHPELWIFKSDYDVHGFIIGDNYNQIGVHLLVTLTIDLLCIKISRWFFLLLIPCLIACTAIPIMVNSMTAVTCIILFLFLCFVPFERLRRMGIISLMIAVALFQVFVCFNGKGIENNDFMVWFVEDILGKDITFTHRTHMWDSALRVIAQSPLFGYGYPTKVWYTTQMTSFAIGPHNMLLATLIYGGIIAFVIYLYLLIVSFFRAFHIHDYWADCIITGISVLCLMTLMEAYPVTIVFTLFILAEYYPLFHRQIISQSASAL